MGSRLESGSNAVRKRIENHAFEDEEGEEYDDSKFGGFGDYFRRKKIKLQNLDAELRSSSPNNPPIFRGVVAHVNGYTQPSLNDLHRMIVSHGGGFLQYLDGKTAATHIIASSLTPKKREEFRKYRIVKPAWVVESIKAGRLLPWNDFKVLDEGQSQKVLKFGGDGQIMSQTNNQKFGYKDQTDSSWYTSQLIQTRELSGGQVEPETPAPSLVTKKMGVPAPESLSTDITSDRIEEDSAGPNNAANSSERADIFDPASPMPTTGSPEKESLLINDTHGHGHTLSEQNLTRGENEMTPEEYNAQLLSDSRMRNSSVVNPEFIQQYYRESRLHHLSTWKAELKAQLQSAAREKSQAGNPTKARVPGARKYILHVDFDCFFAAVTVQKQPELAGKPVAVAHGTGSGSEIASCNYVAREFGIKNGMWMKGALDMCPDLKVVPYDFPAYEDASRKFYDLILGLGGITQSVSIDEALVDITTICLAAGGSDGKGISEGSIYREQAKADEIGKELRTSVKEKTGCDVSVGIGGNILQAKVALRKAKPAGQFQLKPEGVLDFIGNLSARVLPGVAYSLGAKLEELGVKYVKDIRELTKERLITSLGPKTGAKLWDYARGIDPTEVGQETVRKSVSAEINWGIRFVTQTQAEEFVQSLCDELHRRLVENLVKGKQLTMRIMRRSADAPLEPVKHLGHGKCDTFNKSVVLGVATNASDIIGREAISILRSFKLSPGDLRGLGVQMTKLEPIKQSVSGEVESSQKRLNFAASGNISKKWDKPVDPDEVDSPRKGDSSGIYLPEPARSAPSLNDETYKPLNLTGTQFIMPSQVDPKVLSELPNDIRSKFVPKPKTNKSEPTRTGSASPFVTPNLPPQSQLDRETLDALPEDVRAEVLGYYQRAPSPRSQQTASDASWRQPSATSSRLKKSTTPTKPRAGRGRGRPSTKAAGNSTLLQSNFIIPRPLPAPSTSANETSAPTSPQGDLGEDISADFLAALPEDIRREVLEEHKRSRLQKRAHLNLPQTRRTLFPKQQQTTTTTRPSEQRVLSLPPRPDKPTFTSRKLSTLPELRNAMSEWYESFQSDGPYEEDVSALTKYLKRVVLEEKDIAKAVAIVNWLSWLTEAQVDPGADDVLQNDTKDSAAADVTSIDNKWRTAVQQIRDDVNSAVRERGLPPVEFT
ncbi:hypothetical protein AJ80_06509 [Polytolypa hystricis UAMH7299]|uniref:DNA repair protein REV1 n=1 Tax=Polytolypa hystricis (strain UAMH7299) TaxID=1447883 RepID=A0A2B7XVP4_POLH7|nr:hypothetical protein AJ80_06509 [Polytolypa hystricis UAMH7299]